MTTRMWISEQNEADEPYRTMLALHAVSVSDEDWPIVTRSELRRFIDMQAWNDPNGTWSGMKLAEGEGILALYDPEYCQTFVFPFVGHVDGVATYELTDNFAGDWTREA